MKTSTHFSVNPLLLLFGFMVLCPGQNVAFSQDLLTPSQAKAQLHVPWKLLSERLSAIVNQHHVDGSSSTTPLGNHLISVPYDGDPLNWTLASGTLSTNIGTAVATIAPTAANVSLSSTKLHIVLDSLTLDQVIERNVGGVAVRVHLNAVCGPITIDQANAAAQSVFTLNWANGSPTATLTALDLSWVQNSWTFNDFTCTGPSGLDALVREGLTQFLQDPSSLKPYVESYISQNLQSSVDATLAKLRAPFAIGASTEAVTVNVGALEPATTGAVADLTLRTDAKTTPLPALPLPSEALLSTLSQSQPSLVGDKSLIEYIVNTRLAAKPATFQINLQNVKAFHDLMHSRLEQLFVWIDLWNYPESYPFYLNIYNPRTLSLSHTSGSSLTSNIPFNSLIQSYRDNTWWSYVVTKGTAALNVALSVKTGTLSYATTVDSMNIKSAYGAAYAKKYDKGSGPLPDTIVEKSITGPQAALSGTMQWPNIDLDQAGLYQASSLKWLNANTFSLSFSALN